MIVYKTTNLVNNKIYVGQDSKNNPNYLGSGNLIKRALLKYGEENFKKEILEYCSSIEELNELEQYWINKLNSTNVNIGYNISLGGQIGWFKGFKHTDVTLEKLSGENNHFFGKSHSTDSKEKISNSNKGKTPWNKGISPSDETKQKISEGNKGKIGWWNGKNLSDETKQKISESHKGISLSDETKQKISESNKGREAWNKNIEQTTKTKEKISNSLKKIVVQIIDDEIVNEWSDLVTTSCYFSMSRTTIGNYCRIKNFKENKLGLIYKIDYEKTK